MGEIIVFPLSIQRGYFEDQNESITIKALMNYQVLCKGWFLWFVEDIKGQEELISLVYNSRLFAGRMT